MIYFFINILMYLVMILFLIKYFKNIDITSFIIILFNMNTYFILIYKDINFIYGLLVLIGSLILYYLYNLFNKNNDIILIENGKIKFNILIKNYSYRKLINYLKRHHLKVEDVDYCIKSGNQLIIQKKVIF